MSLSDEERAKFSAAFHYIDADNGGSISLGELLTCASDFGFDISLDELRAVVLLVDSSGDGEIDIEEFMEIMTLMLYRHKLVSSSDDDDDDGGPSGAGGGSGGAGGASGGKGGSDDVSSFLSPDGSLSPAATPDEKARAQVVMKNRAAWAADAVQALHTSLQSIDDAAAGIKAARNGVGFEGAEAGGGSASIAAFQMRKAQEAAQATHRIAKASTARLVKRLLAEAQARGITTQQLPQIESLELEAEHREKIAAAAAAAAAAASNTGGGRNNSNSGNNAADGSGDGEGDAAEAEAEEDDNAVDPHNLLKSLRALAAQLKAAAEALGANLVPVSMVKAHHTRGGTRGVVGGQQHQQPSQQNKGAPSSRTNRIVEMKQQQQQAASNAKRGAAASDAIKSQLAALEHFELEDGSSKTAKAGGGGNNRPSTPASTANRGDGERKISERMMSLVSGDATIPGSKTAQQVAAAAPRASDQLRAVAQQVLRSWAFPITPVCEQLDLLDERWAEYGSLLQGQEALTRPACPLGRGCPDRFNHAHRLQLTHPCYCRIDRHALGSPEAREQAKKQSEDPLVPLSDAALCPHMVRPVHGTCYTHLPPLEEVQPPPPTSPLRGSSGGSSPMAMRSASGADLLNMSGTRGGGGATVRLDPAQQRALRFNELRAIVGRLDLSNVDLGGIGAQALAFVIAQDVAVQDSAASLGGAAAAQGRLYAVSSDEYSTSSNHYRFKDLVLHRCGVNPAGAIALLRVAHNLRMLDLSANSVGAKTVVIGSDGSAGGGDGGAAGDDSNARLPTNVVAGIVTVAPSSTTAAAAAASAADKKGAAGAKSAGKKPPPAPKPAAKPAAKAKRADEAAAAEPTTTATTANDTTAAAASDGSGPAAAPAAAPPKDDAAAHLLALQQQQQKEAEAAAAVPSLMGTHLRELLLRHGNLIHLNLANNRLTDSDGIGVAEGLKGNSVLRVLDLSGNLLGPRFGRDFAAALAENDNDDLRCIRFGFNPLEQQGTASVCEALKGSSHLEELDLSWTGLGPQGAAALAEMVSNNGALLRLIIPNNAIQLNGAIAIAKALPSPSASIVHLDVANNTLNELGAVELLNGLRNNRSLATLNITNVAQNAATVMKEVASVMAERLQKMPNAPEVEVIFGEQLSQQVPAHLQAADEPLRLQKVPKPAQQQSGSTRRAPSSASASAPSPARKPSAKSSAR